MPKASIFTRRKAAKCASAYHAVQERERVEAARYQHYGRAGLFMDKLAAQMSDHV